MSETERGCDQPIGVAGRDGELVRPLGESRRICLARVEADQGKRRQRSGEEGVVPEPLRQLDRRARVFLRGRDALAEAEVEAEPLMDQRLQLGAVRRRL